MRPTLIIGDVHGHYDRLYELLRAAGVIDVRGKRVDHDTEVIQIGDLGDCSEDSRAGDLACWELVRDRVIDLVIWGNHDRAVFHPGHFFSAYGEPIGATTEIMSSLVEEERVVIAAHRHGHLITHAGLDDEWRQREPRLDLETAADLAETLVAIESDTSHKFVAVIDAIEPLRGGHDPVGGVLWRHCGRPGDPAQLVGVPQIVGHTKGEDVRRDERGNWCIDIGTRRNGRLAALRLPSMEVVEIRP